ncbi:uncharacterized protein FIBRA_04659 [Fibroporia radiculosa]|uniref:Uncharacterized protein n=1 Tax=Fibroporia radiculosa TaxID=599839 RepID=J4IAA2_9APHY|nr:uncharacterized protein FIBRA_04659 [Fibroporia radiculosa]CCM02556.1 predicted protein [Fibroporia radiculosa]
MAIDMLGGIFSDLSLAFKSQFDVIAAVTYSVVVVMDGAVLVLALILNPIARRRRKRAALTTVDVPDEYSEPADVELVASDPPAEPSSAPLASRCEKDGISPAEGLPTHQTNHVEEITLNERAESYPCTISCLDK